jgi:putative hemolysin
LPEDAVRRRADGELYARGWLVAWRWHADGALEYRADHRMTDERWTVIAADGTVTQRDVPWGFMVTPKDVTAAEKARIEADYRAGWRAHGEAVTAAGLDFHPGEAPADLPRGPEQMLWRLRGEAWRTTDVGSDPRFPAA